jgi:hypothetical protein
LRHEVAEQIKEKTRQAMSTSLNGSSNNGFISSTSIPIEIDHKSNGIIFYIVLKVVLMAFKKFLFHKAFLLAL